MSPSPVMLAPEETQAVLSAVLREVHGANARLVDWSACPVSKRGKHRSLRYDLDVRVAGEAEICRYQWVGKFYEQDADARRVARILRELSTANCRSRGRLIIPGVVTYHTPYYLLLLRYEAGVSMIRAIEQSGAGVLQTLGRALAVLHTTSIAPEATFSPDTLLNRLRKKVTLLDARFPGQTDTLQTTLNRLECQIPSESATSVVHGDLGPSQIFWQFGCVVLLDFDKCALGDPALDLGNLLTQLRRLTLRKPGKLPEFAFMRQTLLDAYQRWSPPDPELARRVAWYEQITLVSKIGFLASDTMRHTDPELLREREAEAVRLLKGLPDLVNSYDGPDFRPVPDPRR